MTCICTLQTTQHIYNIVVAQSLNIGVCLNTVLKQEAKGQF